MLAQNSITEKKKNRDIVTQLPKRAIVLCEDYAKLPPNCSLMTEVYSGVKERCYTLDQESF